MVAFPWLVLQRTGGAVDASVVTVPRPAATVRDAGGWYRGRLPGPPLRRHALGCHVRGVGCGDPVLALVLGTDMLTTVVLAGLAALGAFFDPAGMTARQSMLP